MSFLLLEDLKGQRKSLKAFVPKILLLLVFLLVTDRLLGYVLSHGLDTYYGLDKPAKILLIGHSHTVLGVDKVLLEDLTGLPVAKYARQGANARDRLVMLRQYLDRHGEDVELVVYDVNAYTFSESGLSANSYRLFYPFINELAIETYLDEIDVPGGQLAVREISHAARFSEVTLGLSIRGWLKNWSNFKSGTIDLERLRQQIAADQIRPIGFDAGETELFELTISEVTKRGIPLILAFYPTVDLFNSAEPDKFDLARARISDYANIPEHIYYFDFVPEFQSQHELFYDPIHMNPTGQKEVTRVLANRVNLLLGEG